jgi:outer membrane immunogenic protein
MTRISLFLAAGVSAVAMASAAQAADLIIETPDVPVYEDVAGNWDGFYLGVFGGYGVGEATDDVTDSPIDLDGNWIGGVNAGFDFTLTEGLVLGIVGDVAYLGLDGVSADDIGYDLYWGGSLRGKIGFDGGAFLPYLTAGLAIADAQVEGSGAITGSDTNTHVGWTVGAGVEFAVTEDVSIDLLYKYTDYGTQEYDLSDVPLHEVGFTTSTITAGLNWRF